MQELHYTIRNKTSASDGVVAVEPLVEEYPLRVGSTVEFNLTSDTAEPLAIVLQEDLHVVWMWGGDCQVVIDGDVDNAIAYRDNIPRD